MVTGSQQIALACRLLAVYNDPAETGSSMAVIDVSSGSLTKVNNGYASQGNLSIAEVRCPWVSVSAITWRVSATYQSFHAYMGRGFSQTEQNHLIAHVLLSLGC